MLSEPESEPFIGFVEETFPKRNDANPLAIELLDCCRNDAVPKRPGRQVSQRQVGSIRGRLGVSWFATGL